MGFPISYPLLYMKTNLKKTSIIILLFCILFVFADYIIEEQIHKEFDAFIKKNEDKADITYQSFSFSLRTRTLSIDSVTIAPVGSNNITIDNITIDDISPGIIGKSEIAISISNLYTYPSSLNKDLGVFFDLIDFHNKIIVNFHSKFAYKNSFLDIENLDLNIHNFADIQLDISLGNIQKDNLDINSLTSTDIKKLTIKDVTCTYNDNSFLEKLISFKANENKMTVHEAKTDIQRYLIYLSATHLNNAINNTTMEIITQFINNPKSISFTLSPDNYIELESLLNLRLNPSLVEQLHLKLQ